MFRGGRVDSRGTGIASGLGYAGGGSVNTPKRGLVDSPGRYSYKTELNPKAVREAKRLGILKTPSWIDEQFRDYYSLNEKVDRIPDPAMMGMQGMTTTMYGGEPDIIEGSDIDQIRNEILSIPPQLSTRKDAEDYWKKQFIEDQGYDVDIEKQKEILTKAGLGDELAKFGSGDGETGDTLTEEETRAAFEERIRRENAEELQALIDSQLSKGTPEEEIEKNKKIFQKAYGSGVADDASNMLLSFAGKALKPEATVKSAFGEFFEEEGKRPSERKKYKDAATTAAINAYLTGQTSFKKFEDELGLYSKKLGMKTKLDKATLQDMTIGQHKATISGAGKSDSQLTKAAAENYIASQPEDKGKILYTFSSKKDPLEKLEVEENVNEYFIDSDTKHVYKIIIVDGEVTSKRLY